MIDKGLVQVWFPLEQEHGYPPADVEGIWATPMGGCLYQLENIPFFANGVSRADQVEAHSDGTRLVAGRLAKDGGHSTLRVVVYDESMVLAHRAALEDLGCACEQSETPNLFSVDVPPETDLGRVVDYLGYQHSIDALDFEESALAGTTR
jgi:hypothetical protein